MEEIQLSSDTPYECLSYVWGQEGVERSRPLRFRRENSQSTQTVNVTKSVESALRQLRHDDHDRTLWIDQICINQDDPEEKSKQIRMMAKIYEVSSVVLVWLGVRSERSDEAMSYLRELVEAFDNGQSPSGYAYQSDRAQAVNELLKRPWFERAWTLQEAANARNCKVLCGTEVVDYQILHHLYSGCQGGRSKEWREILECIATSGPTSAPNDERPIMAHILTIAKLKEIREREQANDANAAPAGSALMLFNRLRSCKTQDARDKIFSMYQNLPQSIKNTIGFPDYEMPVEDLYHRVAASQLCEIGNIMYLAAGGTYRRNLPLPSWVPDYTYPETHYSLAVLDEDCFHRTGKHLFRAADQEEASAQVLDDGRTLKLKGRILGNVREIAQSFNFLSRDNRDRSAKLKSQIKELRQHIQECTSMVESYSLDYTVLSPLTVLRLTLTCGMEVLNGGPSFGGVFVRASAEDIDQRFEAFDRYTSAAERMTAGPIVHSRVLADRDSGDGRKEEGGLQIMVYNTTPTAAFNNMKTFADSKEQGLAALAPFEAACGGRAFFITEDNHMGLAPSVTRPEDKVCVIHGCRVPFIIRLIEERKIKTAEGKRIKQKHYVLVGECYIYGFMNGEAVQDNKVEAEDIFLI